MSNWKHTIIAMCAVLTVVSLSVMQMNSSVYVNADKKEINEEPDILQGDGEGTTPAFADYDYLMEQAQLIAAAEAEKAKIAAEESFENTNAYICYSGGTVNVREGASKESAILCSLKFGDALTVTFVEGEWSKVLLDDGTVGYIMSDLLTYDYESVKQQLLSTTMYESGTVSVNGSVLNVRNIPSDSGSFVIGQIDDGSVVYILERADTGWYKIYYGADYDIGYVMSDFISSGELVLREQVDKERKDRLNSVAKNGTVVTNAGYVNVRVAPSENADIVTTFKNGDKCKVISQGSKWTKILINSGIAYITSSAVLDDKAYDEYNKKQKAARMRAESVEKKTKSNTSSSGRSVNSPAQSSAVPVSYDGTMGSRIISEAEKYIGTKYVYGGSSPSGFDCSGFVMYTMNKVGIKVNRSSRDQYKNGVAVAKADLMPGDLVFFSKGGSISHVGIYAGGGKVIHSPRPGEKVCYTTLSHMCSYSTYVGARRVY